MTQKITLIIITLITVVIGFSLTSCDAIIADKLEGTWEGDMYSVAEWDGQTYDATYTELDFGLDPFSVKKGTGHWVDYYSSAPFDYIANHMTWEVKNQVIYIHLEEDDVDIEIRHYSLSDEHFRGEIYYNNNGIEGTRQFSLIHTSSPNWEEDYEYYDYDYAKSAGSVSLGAKSANGTKNDSTSVTRPHRSFRIK